MSNTRVTVCILTFSEYLSYFRRCLDSVACTVPLDGVEFRLGFNHAPTSLGYALGRLCPVGVAPVSERLPCDVERLAFPSPWGGPVRLWNSRVNLYKEPMCRLMYYDVPLETEYAVWLDDDSFVCPGWWEDLQALFDQGVDYIGQEWWVQYLPGQAEMIQSQSWYRGVPFEVRNGREGARFMTGGFMAVRAARLREANFPDTGFRWKNDTLKQYGGDTLLGEIARQLGWTRAVYDRHVRVNVDLQGQHPAPRRGGTSRQFGSDLDIAVH